MRGWDTDHPLPSTESQLWGRAEGFNPFRQKKAAVEVRVIFMNHRHARLGSGGFSPVQVKRHRLNQSHCHLGAAWEELRSDVAWVKLDDGSPSSVTAEGVPKGDQAIGRGWTCP